MRLENSFVLFPGIGEKTEQKLWKNDLTHWDDVLNCSSAPARCPDTEIMEKAKKNLEAENSMYFGSQLPNNEQWRMYRNFEDSFCFFDIETTGLDPEKNKVTTVSFHRNGEDTTLVRGEDLTSEKLQEEIFSSSAFVSFNGKRFDQPFLEKNFDIQMNKPHIDLMYLCRNLGISGGLKEVEKKLEIQRELEDIDGREAVRLWKQYSRHGDDKALEKLKKYNRYDARNLQQLLETVHTQLKPDILK